MINNKFYIICTEFFYSQLINPRARFQELKAGFCIIYTGFSIIKLNSLKNIHHLSCKLLAILFK